MAAIELSPVNETVAEPPMENPPLAWTFTTPGSPEASPVGMPEGWIDFDGEAVESSGSFLVGLGTMLNITAQV